MWSILRTSVDIRLKFFLWDLRVYKSTVLLKNIQAVMFSFHLFLPIHFETFFSTFFFVQSLKLCKIFFKHSEIDRWFEISFRCKDTSMHIITIVRISNVDKQTIQIQIPKNIGKKYCFVKMMCYFLFMFLFVFLLCFLEWSIDGKAKKSFGNALFIQLLNCYNIRLYRASFVTEEYFFYLC